MQKLITFFRRAGFRVFLIAQKVFLSVVLFFLYFFIFGWFSLLAKQLEKARLRRDRLSSNSFWLKPALNIPNDHGLFNQS
ncbi:hypothetical protein EBR03_01700 [bacterium]|nr:hypothetical protein [bacterium]NBX83751.1 hypothetical protein [bacterium]